MPSRRTMLRVNKDELDPHQEVNTHLLPLRRLSEPTEELSLETPLKPAHKHPLRSGSSAVTRARPAVVNL